MSEQPSVGLDNFLTPEAMLTPGAAGGVTMLIANGLANNFGVPPSYTSYIGLFLSFVFGLLVLVSARKILTKVIYYILNSLVIFCVAFGTGSIAAAKAERMSSSISFNLVSLAYAGENPASDLNALRENYAKLDAQYHKEAEALTTLQKNGAKQSVLDKQVALLQDLQHKKSENLQLQSQILSKAQVGAAPKSNPAGGQNPFFRQWSSPF